MKWWQASWNPIVGCSPASIACDNCYAAREAAIHARNSKTPQYKGLVGDDGRYNGAVRLVESQLSKPLSMRKGKRIFVCNMGDLFHENVPFGWVDQVFAVMAMCPQHTFYLLTKRPERMKGYITQRDKAGWRDHLSRVAYELTGVDEADCLVSNSIEGCLGADYSVGWPMRRVWLGTSIWDQPSADHNISVLLATPAAKYFVSYEPGLGPVDLDRIHTSGITETGSSWHNWESAISGKAFSPWAEIDVEVPRLDWVICGGETGPGARPLHPDWARSLRDQCASAGVPFFFKHWGEWGVCLPSAYGPQAYEEPVIPWEGKRWSLRVGSHRAGRLLENREHNEIPQSTERACRVCGCTQNRACPGGCWWVEEDLCSACVGKEVRS